MHGNRPLPRSQVARFLRWLIRRKPPAAAESKPLWFDDDDPLARVVNAAWESGEPIFWQEGDPLPEPVAKPLKVERNDLDQRHAPDCRFLHGDVCSCGRGADQDRPV